MEKKTGTVAAGAKQPMKIGPASSATHGSVTCLIDTKAITPATIIAEIVAAISEIITT